MDSGLPRYAPKSASADLGAIKHRSRVNPRSVARNDSGDIGATQAECALDSLFDRFFCGEPVHTSPANALMPHASIPRVSGRSRERDRVAHVGEAGDVGEGALEAEAEAGLPCRSRCANMTVCK